MHLLNQLQKNLENPVFFSNQFKMVGQRNILYVEPQLSSKHLYKSIFPFFYLFDGKRDKDGKLEEIYTSVAVTGLDKYNPEEQLFSIHTILNEEWIRWSDIIVFPFTCGNLLDEYEKIESVNPNCKIVFNVDFNYYELSGHPYNSMSNFISNIEMNILASDVCLTANHQLREYIIEKLTPIVKSKSIKNNTKFCNIPPFIDPYMCNQNIEEESPMIRIVMDAAKKAKKKKPAKKSKNKEQEAVKVELGEPITVGIIYSKTYRQYYKAFNQALKNMPSNVTLVIIGYDPSDDKDDVFNGVRYEYSKPCSIVHFFKQLYSSKLDLCLIPVLPDAFSVPSEIGNRVLECGIFGIPVLAPNMFPYHSLIQDNKNGFLFQNPNDAIEKIKYISTIMPFVRNSISQEAKNNVLTRYTWSKENAQFYRMTINS